MPSVVIDIMANFKGDTVKKSGSFTVLSSLSLTVPSSFSSIASPNWSVLFRVLQLYVINQIVKSSVAKRTKIVQPSKGTSKIEKYSF